MAKEGSGLHALLQWLNSLRVAKVDSLDDISSGASLWEVLQDIDPEAFSGDLPCPIDARAAGESWSDNLDNLNHIYKVLTAYIVDRCRRKLPLPSGEPDLKAIAKSTSENDVSQLLKLVLLAAVFGRFSMDYIQQLTSLSEAAQARFFLILQEPEELPSPEPEIFMNEDDKPIASSQDIQSKNPELVYEEHIAGLVAVNQSLKQETIELKEQLENMHDRHTQLQKSYDLLDVQQQDTAERLEALRSGKGEQSILGIQRTKMQQQETVIATLESQLNSLQDENNNLKVQTDVLHRRAEGFQQLQDDLYELKLEHEKLQRKANAADKYKQKLQSLQSVEDENEVLKHRVTDMQRQLKESDSDHFINADIRRENEEIRSLVSNIEQELTESIEAKKRAEFEKMTLEAKLQQADDQAARWHARAEELQASRFEDASTASPVTPRATVRSELDLNAPEDEGSPQPDSELGKEISKMQIDDQNIITDGELQAIISIMKAHTQNASNMEKTSSIHEQQKFAAKIEKTRATVKELYQQTKEQDSLIVSLRAELESATRSASITSTPHQSTPYATAQPDSDLGSDRRFAEVCTQKANLERELELMASAWYDQNLRLMSNVVGASVSRGRPTQEPKSFLGKQRRVVDGVLTGRS